MRLPRGDRYAIRGDGYRTATYRPFNKQKVYFDRRLNNTVYRLNEIFPSPDSQNSLIYVSAPGG